MHENGTKSLLQQEIEQIQKQRYAEHEAKQSAEYYLNAGKVPTADCQGRTHGYDAQNAAAFPFAPEPLAARAGRLAQETWSRAEKQSRISHLLVSHPEFELFMELQRLMQEVGL